MGKDIQHYPGTCEVTMAALAKTSFTLVGNALGPCLGNIRLTSTQSCTAPRQEPQCVRVSVCKSTGDVGPTRSASSPALA